MMRVYAKIRRLEAVRCILKVRLLSLCGIACFTGLLLMSWGSVCRAEQRTIQVVKVVDSFESCVAAGGQVQLDRGERCTTETGQVFEKPAKTVRTACMDLCGDGKCQEIVCMAIGCPCAESARTCPVDCKK